MYYADVKDKMYIFKIEARHLFVFLKLSKSLNECIFSDVIHLFENKCNQKYFSFFAIIFKEKNINTILFSENKYY